MLDRVRARSAWLLLPLLGLSAHAAESSGAGRVVVVDAALLGDRLRVGGKPGDLALIGNGIVTVVRKRDGYLVDLWRKDPVDASAAQLKLTPNIDGLWMLHPVVIDGHMAHNLTASTVRSVGNAIETQSEIALGAGRMQVTTRYSLHPTQPRVVMESTLTHAGGGKLTHVALGDLVKWGNVDYFVDGHGRTAPTFSGTGRWVGRHGAGGDMMLRTLQTKPMVVSYRARHLGLAAEIKAQYGSGNLAPGQQLVVRRELAFEALPASSLSPKPGATLVVDLTDEHGRPVAAKLDIRGTGGTVDPNFGNDGDETGAAHFAWSGSGRFVRTLPVGKYKLLATAGIERDAARFEVEIRPHENVFLRGSLPRVITTPGQIAADLHLHQSPSVDADIGLATRLVSVAAEGVELAVASDHYAVTDFAPMAKALFARGALATKLVTVVGSEISTVGNRFGHFNLIPMQLTDQVDYENTSPKALFAAMRKVSPEGIIQVNHPRWDDIGYFHRYKLDPKTARLPATVKDEFTWDFDALEVMNGVDAVSEAKVRKVLFDWIRLLGQGHRFVGTGSSDSHKLFFVDPGIPRTMIRFGGSDSDSSDLNVDPKVAIAALKRGAATVTTGPILDVTLDGKRPGEVVQGGGDKELHLTVRAAPWIAVDEVEVLLGPQGNRVRWISIPKGTTGVVRLDKRFNLRVPAGSFVVVVAKGHTPLPNVYQSAIKPFAFSNPVWVAAEP
ncbi:MAG: CehA/McbA family metallohydrolase [Polyangiaceae bacterium]